MICDLQEGNELGRHRKEHSKLRVAHLKGSVVLDEAEERGRTIKTLLVMLLILFFILRTVGSHRRF